MCMIGLKGNIDEEMNMTFNEMAALAKSAMLAYVHTVYPSIGFKHGKPKRLRKAR